MDHQSANGRTASAGGSVDFANLDVAEIKTVLADFVRQGGPHPADYPTLQALMDTISTMRAAGAISDAQNDALWESIGDVGTTKTLMGFIYRKPYGYHGDFEIIDKFYTGHTSPDESLRRWDQWIQSLEATQAVRNRKAFFHDLLSTLDGIDSPKILSVGSGPCRDLLEAFESLHVPFTATCVDLDESAIAYASKLLAPHARRVTLVKKNVLRVDFPPVYDLVWSAGLFDYLDDRLFVMAMKRLYRSVRPGGRIVIGNFSRENSSRSAMEWGNWRLLHRSDDELRRLVGSANLDHAELSLTSEPLGVNSFVSILKPEDRG